MHALNRCHMSYSSRIWMSPGAHQLPSNVSTPLLLGRIHHISRISVGCLAGFAVWDLWRILFCSVHERYFRSGFWKPETCQHGDCSQTAIQRDCTCPEKQLALALAPAHWAPEDLRIHEGRRCVRHTIYATHCAPKVSDSGLGRPGEGAVPQCAYIELKRLNIEICASLDAD